MYKIQVKNSLTNKWEDTILYPSKKSFGTIDECKTAIKIKKDLMPNGKYRIVDIQTNKKVKAKSKK